MGALGKLKQLRIEMLGHGFQCRYRSVEIELDFAA